MSRFTSNLFKTLSLIVVIFISITFVLAENEKYVGEDYYENNIEAAVIEARQNKRQLNYNKHHWYNRTTSRSFELKPLEKRELDQERLEGALAATAAEGTQTISENKSTSEKQGDLVQKELSLRQLEANPTLISKEDNKVTTDFGKFTPLITHSHQKFDVRSTNVISTGTITSTPRP